MRLGVALIALAIVAVTAYLGRRDLSRPAVVFGLAWFAFVAAAQLQLTPTEADWSAAFAATTIGGGLGPAPPDPDRAGRVGRLRGHDDGRRPRVHARCDSRRGNGPRPRRGPAR